MMIKHDQSPFMDDNKQSFGNKISKFILKMMMPYGKKKKRFLFTENIKSKQNKK